MDRQIQEQKAKAERWRSRKRIVDEPVAQFVQETSEKVF